jgi:hypothetical protein
VIVLITFPLELPFEAERLDSSRAQRGSTAPAGLVGSARALDEWLPFSRRVEIDLARHLI